MLSTPEFYHRSAVRRKGLQTVLPTMKAYPSYHDVRLHSTLTMFAKMSCIIRRGFLPWTSLSEDATADRGERQKARGFLNTFIEDSVNTYLTSLMSDVCSVFQTLQKQLQKTSIIIPDIMKYNDIAIDKRNAKKNAPYVGGAEEKWLKENESLDVDTTENAPHEMRHAKKRIVWSMVCTEGGLTAQLE